MGLRSTRPAAYPIAGLGGPMSIRIRAYREADALAVGRLIQETFRTFNLSYAAPDEQEKLLGPFRHAHSDDPTHQQRIAEVIEAPMVLVAEDSDTSELVGVLRARPGRLHSLFVRSSHHRQGIGRRLMERLERETIQRGGEKITMQATLFAVPFYERLGYVRSTGIRSGSCFDATGFTYQPMKKTLTPPKLPSAENSRGAARAS